jgi:succinate dehydrogenase/fumarate reductase flavoprotein subunit
VRGLDSAGGAGLGVLSVSGNGEAMVEAVRGLGNVSRDAEGRRSMHETRTDEAVVL